MSGHGPPPHDASPGGRVALYRFYDAHETLLYAGISKDPWRRRKEHALTQPWYPQVRHQAITWYDTVDAARRAEDKAIWEERPARNVAGAFRPARSRITIRLERLAKLAVGVMLPILVLEPVVIYAPFSWDVRFGLVLLVLSMTFLGIIGSAIVAGVAVAPRFGAWIGRNTVYPGQVAPGVPVTPAGARR
jgi:hypothetical protein